MKIQLGTQRLRGCLELKTFTRQTSHDDVNLTRACLSEPNSSNPRPTHAEGCKPLPNKETATPKAKILSQQIFHPGLFNRQKTTVTDGYNENQNPAVPWQRVPKQKQKRIRSPNEKETTSKVFKKTSTKNNPCTSQCTSQIETSNRFMLLSDDEPGHSSPTVNETKKPSKSPPVILYGIDDLQKLTEFIEEALKKDDYTYKVVSKDQLIISSTSVEKYKILIEHIRTKGLISHTFTQKDEKCMRIVIKHLHFSTPKEAIIEAIELSGNKVKGEIVTARKRGTKEQLNTFFVNICPHENNRLVKDIQYIYHQKVKIEDPKRKTTVEQCTRCQQYGHTKNNCMRPYRCVKCAGPHKTTSCTIDRNTPAVCTLCSGSHPANYKSCQVYKEILTKKQIGNRLKGQHKQKATGNTEKQDNNIPATLQKTIAQLNQPNTQSNNREHNVWHNYNELDFPPLPKLNHNPATAESKPSQASAVNYGSQITSTKHDDESKSQSTNFCKTDNRNTPQEHRSYNLEAILIKQSEKIDQLLSQISTMMNVIMTLMSKLSQ